MIAELMTTTYSMWSLFRSCRKAVEWRYIEQLVPLQRDHNLHFGSLIHECLELWHGERDLAKVLDRIDRLCPNRAQDEDQKRDWLNATATIRGYAEHYPTEEFEIVALEKTFEGPIVNPATGAASRSFVLAGKVDGIVRIDGEYFLLEHKTASQTEQAAERSDYDSVPDGKYQVNVEKAELAEAHTSGNPMLKWTLRVIAPQCVNRLMWRNSVITQKTLKYLKADLHLCGLDLERLSDLPNHLGRLLDVKIEVTKRTKGDNENIFFNRRIDNDRAPGNFRQEAGDALVPF